MGSQTFGTDYSYLRISINKCDTDELKRIGFRESECFDTLESAEYFKGVRVVATIDDGYIDLKTPRMFIQPTFEPKSRKIPLFKQTISPESSHSFNYGVQLNQINYF